MLSQNPSTTKASFGTFMALLPSPVVLASGEVCGAVAEARSRYSLDRLNTILLRVGAGTLLSQSLRGVWPIAPLLPAVLERDEHSAERTRNGVETPNSIGDVVDAISKLKLRNAPGDH
jgi:hypothetical protein